MKKLTAFLLAVLLLFSLAACGDGSGTKQDSDGDDGKDVAEEKTDITKTDLAFPLDDQINLIAANIDLWQGDELNFGRGYLVSDFDRNGRLEIVSSICQGTGLFTVSKIWEVSDDCTKLVELTPAGAEGSSQPDIMTESVSAYYSKSGELYYIFSDAIRAGYAANSVSITALSLKDSTVTSTLIGYVENTYNESASDYDSVYYDADGNTVSAEDYAKLTAQHFADCTEYTVSLGWQYYTGTELLALDGGALHTMLTESYTGFALKLA